MHKQCPYCHEPNPAGALFCQGCGAELARRCDHCGQDAPADARFCPHCGEPILATPRLPWWEKLAPEVRLALFSLGRGLGWTLILLAFLVALLTPPPRIFDELILLVLGGLLLVGAEVIKPRDDDGPGGPRRDAPPDQPPGGLELEHPFDARPVDALRDSEQVGVPEKIDGPRLN